MSARGEVQAVQALPSSLHSKLAVPSGLVKVRFAVVALVSAAGWPLRAVSGAVVSTTQV